MDVNALAYVDRGLLGCRYGSARPHHDIPLMVDFYKSGHAHARRAGVAHPSPRALRRGGRRDARRTGGAWRPHLRLETAPCQRRAGGAGRGHEGRHPRRRDRLAPVPPHPDHEQAPPADLRPADDRLVHRGRGRRRDRRDHARDRGDPRRRVPPPARQRARVRHQPALLRATRRRRAASPRPSGWPRTSPTASPVLVMLADNVVERSIQPDGRRLPGRPGRRPHPARPR